MIKKLINENKLIEAYQLFIEMHPHDQAIAYQLLTKDEQDLLDKQLSDDELSAILAYIEPLESANILADFNLDKQVNLIEQMEIDDAVDVIKELEASEQETILKRLDNRINYRMFLDYDEDQAGSLMTSAYIEFETKIDVKDAMRILIANAPNVESINTLFIVDEGKYIGTVHLNKLIKAKSPLLIDELIEKTPVINDKEEIDVALHIMREYALYEIAVENDNHDLIGIITLDDAIAAFEKTATTDFMQFAAINEKEDKSIYKSAKKRIPWLLFLLIASIPVALISMAFEEVILSFAILALFQPLILDASGDVATQTLAVTLRKINQTDGASIKDGITEVITGSINGVILGLTSAIITYFLAIAIGIDEPFTTSLVVGLSLLITVIIGPIFGYIIPVTLNKFNFDPAVASGPFITTLVDLVSLIVFFGLAGIFLMGG